MQLNFLFWNTGLATPDPEIAQLARDCDAHIIVLSEYDGDGKGALRELLAIKPEYNFIPPIGCERIRLFVSFPVGTIEHGPETGRYTIKQLSLPGHSPITLCLAHLHSKLHTDAFDQLHHASYFKRAIEEGEKAFNHSNTIVIGDLNMNPFDPGMMSTSGLNAVSCIKVAARVSRSIDEVDHLFFYNPCWNLLGDFNQPAGTFFHGSPGTQSHYWNTLDQVVLRPAVAEKLIKTSLRIITKAGGVELNCRKGRPKISDHFPISFSMNLD